MVKFSGTSRSGCLLLGPACTRRVVALCNLVRWFIKYSFEVIGLGDMLLYFRETSYVCPLIQCPSKPSLRPTANTCRTYSVLEVSLALAPCNQ